MDGQPTGPSPGLIVGLREQLNQWDPIDVLGAVADPPADEYDGLLSPLASRLAAPDAEREIAAYLTRQMRDVFGLDPEVVGVDAFVARLLAWYADVWLAGGGRAAR